MTECCLSNTTLPSIWLKIADEESLEEELDDLFGFYKGFMSEKIKVDLSTQRNGSGDNGEELITFMLQESNLPLTKLVDEIYDRLNLGVASSTIMLEESVTYDSVRSTLLREGDRVSYALSPDADADKWEDTTDSYLWCWEMNYWNMLERLSESIAEHICNRFYCRQNIVYRIRVVSEIIEVLQEFQEASLNFMESEDIFRIRREWGNFVISLEEAKLKRKRIRQILRCI